MGLSFFNFVSAPVHITRDLNRPVYFRLFLTEKQTTNHAELLFIYLQIECLLWWARAHDGQVMRTEGGLGGKTNEVRREREREREGERGRERERRETRERRESDMHTNAKQTHKLIKMFSLFSIFKHVQVQISSNSRDLVTSNSPRRHAQNQIAPVRVEYLVRSPNVSLSKLDECVLCMSKL